MSDALPCIVCGKELKNVFEDATNQPSNGTTFMTHGHYGSTVFDEIDGRFLEINICDECVRNASDNGRIYVGRHIEPKKIVSDLGTWRWDEFMLTEEQIEESLREDD